MRKIMFMVMLAAGVLLARAGEYGYLVFMNTSGSTTALTVSNLSATVNGSTLVVTNDDGAVNFALTDLASMQFSTTNIVTAMENVLDGNQPLQVFSIHGTSLGTYNSLVQAAQQLGTGVYVISNGINAQTIVVK